MRHSSSGAPRTRVRPSHPPPATPAMAASASSQAPSGTRTVPSGPSPRTGEATRTDTVPAHVAAVESSPSLLLDATVDEEPPTAFLSNPTHPSCVYRASAPTPTTTASSAISSLRRTYAATEEVTRAVEPGRVHTTSTVNRTRDRMVRRSKREEQEHELVEEAEKDRCEPREGEYEEEAEEEEAEDEEENSGDELSCELRWRSDTTLESQTPIDASTCSSISATTDLPEQSRTITFASSSSSAPPASTFASATSTPAAKAGTSSPARPTSAELGSARVPNRRPQRVAPSPPALAPPASAAAARSAPRAPQQSASHTLSANQSLSTSTSTSTSTSRSISSSPTSSAPQPAALSRVRTRRRNWLRSSATALFDRVTGGTRRRRRTQREQRQLRRTRSHDSMDLGGVSASSVSLDSSEDHAAMGSVNDGSVSAGGQSERLSGSRDRSATDVRTVTTLGWGCLGLREISDSICVHTSLTHLLLNNNTLRSLPDGVSQLRNLTYLNVTRNKLTSLPPSIGKLTELSVLLAGDNRIASLPASFTQLSALCNLDLSSNELTRLPDNMPHLCSLESLTLNHNQLHALPDLPVTLRQLSLVSNRLTELGQGLCALTRLNTLDLRSNRIASVSPRIGQLDQLNILLLQRNQLRSLPYTVLHLHRLRRLCLHNNLFARELDPLLAAADTSADARPPNGLTSLESASTGAHSSTGVALTHLRSSTNTGTSTSTSTNTNPSTASSTQATMPGSLEALVEAGRRTFAPMLCPPSWSAPSYPPPLLSLCLRELYANSTPQDLLLLETLLPPDLAEFFGADGPSHLCYQCLQRFFHTPLEDSRWMPVTVAAESAIPPHPLAPAGWNVRSVIISDVQRPEVLFSLLFCSYRCERLFRFEVASLGEIAS